MKYRSKGRPHPFLEWLGKGHKERRHLSYKYGGQEIECRKVTEILQVASVRQ